MPILAGLSVAESAATGTAALVRGETGLTSLIQQAGVQWCNLGSLQLPILGSSSSPGSAPEYLRLKVLIPMPLDGLPDFQEPNIIQRRLSPVTPHQSRRARRQKAASEGSPTPWAPRWECPGLGTKFIGSVASTGSRAFTERNLSAGYHSNSKKEVSSYFPIARLPPTGNCVRAQAHHMARPNSKGSHMGTNPTPEASPAMMN
ncbi:Endogenous retrovirus group S71 member 1 Env polyprotein, partial [Plecturocebus cupreus]